MNSSKLRLILALGAMFILGAVSGVALTFFCHPHFGPPHAGEMKDHFVSFLTRRLNLTADQQEKIKPIAADFASKADGLHQQSFNEFKQLADATDARIAELLTPEQKTELDKLRQERDKNFPMRGGPDGPSGPPGS